MWSGLGGSRGQGGPSASEGCKLGLDSQHETAGKVTIQHFFFLQGLWSLGRLSVCRQYYYTPVTEPGLVTLPPLILSIGSPLDNTTSDLRIMKNMAVVILSFLRKTSQIWKRSTLGIVLLYTHFNKVFIVTTLLLEYVWPCITHNLWELTVKIHWRNHVCILLVYHPNFTSHHI